MSGNDDTDSTRANKPKSRVPPAPLLVAGALYSREQLIEALGLNNRTLKKWRAAGLKVRCPGTRAGFVFSDDVFKVIRRMTDKESR